MKVGELAFARLDVGRARPFAYRFERGEIGIAALQRLELAQPKADRGELAAQKLRRHSVPLRRPVGVDDDDQPVWLQCVTEMPQESVGEVTS
jgi:hypothetical protein